MKSLFFFLSLSAFPLLWDYYSIFISSGINTYPPKTRLSRAHMSPCVRGSDESRHQFQLLTSKKPRTTNLTGTYLRYLGKVRHVYNPPTSTL